MIDKFHLSDLILGKYKFLGQFQGAVGKQAQNLLSSCIV